MEAVRLVEIDPAHGDARACLARYYAELDRRFPEGFVVERSHDPDRALLRRPRGTFLIAYHGDRPAGCVALKAGGARFGEIKRLWIDPQSRGQGLAALLMNRAEAVARELGLTALRLDTHSALGDAAALYRRWGWTETARFNDDPYAHLFFEKSL